MTAHFRSLIILRGRIEDFIATYPTLKNKIAGDWITLSSHPQFGNLQQPIIDSNKAKLLLGQEFKHAVFDATQSFNLDAFAILCGCLIADSILIIILPEDLTQWSDQDSLRWNEQELPITVPNFVTHLKNVIAKHKILFPKHVLVADKLVDIENDIIDLSAKNSSKSSIKSDYKSNQQQQNVLHKLQTSNAKINLVTAKRGRGKSSLAGMFCNHVNAWVTAPNKNAIKAINKFAQNPIQFFAPDELIKQLNEADSRPEWLIIDEAAMIPLPMLEQLLVHDYRVLLTTTIDGYEGTGQGLLLKLLQQQTSVEIFTLSEPIRWQNGDPIESFIEKLTLADSNYSLSTLPSNQFSYSKITQSELVNQPNLLSSFFGLLKSAHYRTSLIDLRRLLDAQKISLFCAKQQSQIVGALITVDEGGLPNQLIEQIWNGTRRPKGNLVAQSLVAHAGDKQAAKLHSMRINRIAVDSTYRRQAIATRLIELLKTEANHKQLDFISVSFAYSEDIMQFWQKMQFSLVHIGTHKEASSGSYAVMAIYPISDKGFELKERLQSKLERDWYWLQHYIKLNLPIEINNNQQVNSQDSLELTHFATTYYPYSASLAVLNRFLRHIEFNSNVNKQAPLLTGLFKQKLTLTEVAKKTKLTGKMEVIKALRQEVLLLLALIGKPNV
ncbi:GNAT family N-acetyltransferase [Orbaceae bacterium ac157xtp]